MATIPLGLKTALEAGNCVLFLGAGIGAHLIGGDGEPLPRATQLAEQMAAHFGVSNAQNLLPKVSQLVEIKKGRAELDSYLRKRFASVEPDETFGWITSIRWKAIFTTNYDNGLERAYERSASPPQTPVVITSSKEFADYNPTFQVPIYHIHGAVFGNRQSVVITKDDYARFRQHRQMLFERLKEHFATSPFLYIGYGNEDPNWALVLDELTIDFYPSKLPHSFRVSPGTDEADIEILEAKSIHTIDSDFASFTALARAALADTSVDAGLLGTIKAGVPRDLLTAFDQNPASVMRLLNSWEYVNQAPFEQNPNISAFLKGNRPNWATIGNHDYFVRDIATPLYDELLDFATSSTSKPVCALLTGSAGYGTTTVLMGVAAQLVQENVRSIFFHRPGTPVLEGDIEFAATILKDPPFFIVDEASSYTGAIATALDTLSNMNRPAFFLLGSRRNEWSQVRFRPRKKQFIIEPLSDAEIERLIDFLSKNRALNKLEGLERPLQIAEIKRRHSKELLVAMRSATEGSEFDAIIENEYHGITDDTSRYLYLATCALYQHGAYLRDYIAAKVIEVDHTALYTAIEGSLDGVVIFDCIDEGQGTYGARARHRTIAQIVWERCGERSTKDLVLKQAIENLNLTYRADAQAFEQLIRSDRIVDEISTLEGKITFFDAASRKDPDNPYVQQHYARMLLRAKKFDLALLKIDAGIDINPSTTPRSLHHTKAIILTEIMKDAQSDNIGLKRLAQAETILTANIRANPKDQYSHQSLAALYFEWAKREGISSEQAAEYIAKAENAITAGLRVVHDRDGLWIISSEIEHWLGDDPARLKALRRAVQDTPGSIVARFLLARALRSRGDYEGAITVLKPVIETYPDEYRAFLEYALALVDLGRSPEAIQILSLSTLYGHSDCRYLSTHGGLLYLAGEYPKAQSIFEIWRKKDFDEEELRTPLYKPNSEAGNPSALKLTGKVAIVNPGYCFIDVPPGPKIMCPSSKYGAAIMRPGLPVSFTLSFNARGPIAHYPTPLSVE